MLIHIGDKVKHIISEEIYIATRILVDYYTEEIYITCKPIDTTRPTKIYLKDVLSKALNYTPPPEI